MYIRHVGPPIYHPWWSFAGVIFLLLLFAAVVALLIWAVLRLTEERPAPLAGWRGLPQGQRPGWRPDVALEHARYRYARGEIGREEFMQISTDLGAPYAAPPPPPSASDVPPPSAPDVSPPGGAAAPETPIA